MSEGKQTDVYIYIDVRLTLHNSNCHRVMKKARVVCYIESYLPD